MEVKKITIRGANSQIEPLEGSRHGDALWTAIGEGHDDLWVFMKQGPFPARGEFDRYLQAVEVSTDPLYFAIVDPDNGRAMGHCGLLRIDPPNYVIEIGALVFSPALQRTRAATEVIYLMAKHVFDDLGYRRLEWKCNTLNEASRRAALRFGFTFEGIFRQHMIVKGRNRDSAWFSMLDSEWPARRQAFERWLDPANFDAAGRQKTRLNDHAPGASA